MIKKIKDKLFHRKKIDFDKAQLVEYWGYDKGLDLSEIKRILIKNNFSIMEESKTPHFKCRFLNYLEEKFNNNPYFMLIAKKRY